MPDARDTAKIEESDMGRFDIQVARQKCLEQFSVRGLLTAAACGNRSIGQTIRRDDPTVMYERVPGRQHSTIYPRGVNSRASALEKRVQRVEVKFHFSIVAEMQKTQNVGRARALRGGRGDKWARRSSLLRHYRRGASVEKW